MPFHVQRRVRDNQHGTIDLRSFEDQIISHPWFQRLRYIRQLGFFHLVFPGAQHSRFEHSLGVMHLAGECFHKLKENLSRAQNREQALREHCASRGISCPPEDSQGDRLGYELSNQLFASSYAEDAFRAAALLHDVGHCPYSHCTERFLPTYQQIFAQNPDLPEYLKAAMAKSATTAQNSQGRSCHEAFSLLLAWQILSELEEHCPCHKEDILAIINPHIPLHPNSPFHPTRSSGKGFSILGDLLSGQWDVDRMDYLRRDSQQAGVQYGEFDYHRIMDSMYVVWNRESAGYCLGFDLDATEALEDFLRARQSMFLQLYFHKTSVASEAMILHLSKMLSGWCFPADGREYAALRDHDLEGTLSQQLENCRGLSADELQRGRRIIRGLFAERKLWKRVFELKGELAAILTDSQRVQNLLTEKGIAHEVIPSVNYLTRPTDHQTLSGTAKYRWIEKDSLGFRRVISHNPMENKLEKHPPFHMIRVYVENERLYEASSLIS